jgi:hypothetical protein
MSLGDHWQRQYEHAQERYEAQFRLNAELIAGLKKAQAEAWDEGWRAAQEIVELEGKKVWAHTVFPEGYEGNPYREAE